MYFGYFLVFCCRNDLLFLTGKKWFLPEIYESSFDFRFVFLKRFYIWSPKVFVQFSNKDINCEHNLWAWFERMLFDFSFNYFFNCNSTIGFHSFNLVSEIWIFIMLQVFHLNLCYCVSLWFTLIIFYRKFSFIVIMLDF